MDFFDLQTANEMFSILTMRAVRMSLEVIHLKIIDLKFMYTIRSFLTKHV